MNGLIPRSSNGNVILDSLPVEKYHRLLPHFETVSFSAKENICTYDENLPYIFFPYDGLVCLFITMENGATAEVGVVGSEGVVGIPVFMRGAKNFSQSIALTPLSGLRIKTEIILEEFNSGEVFRDSILRYAHDYCFQITQLAACSRVHRLENRLARWLLMAHDRVNSDKIDVTQEFISQMLGTRRPYVTHALGMLQKENILNCARGYIKILNRTALEDYSCECYALMPKISSVACSRCAEVV